jgi:hypothetical protein
VEPLLNPNRRLFRWWQNEWPLTSIWEAHASEVDPSIERLPLALMRNHPGVRSNIERLRVPKWDVWGYVAPAEGPWPLRRLVALFLRHPHEQDPVVLSLDGPRDSKHRNGPKDASLELCLYYSEDPDERRWKPSDGLPRLFDLGRRHLLCEHIWRERGRRDADWPVEDAPHGYGAPAKSNPALALPAELPQLGARLATARP